MNDEQKMPDREIIAINRRVRQRLEKAHAKLDGLKKSNPHLEGWELPDENDPEPVIVLLVTSQKDAGDFPAQIAGFQVEVDIEDSSHLKVVEEGSRGYDPDHPIFYRPKRPPWPRESDD